MQVFGKSLTLQSTPPPSALTRPKEAQMETDNVLSHAEAREEALWAERVRQGDLEAFDNFMTRYRERAIRLATLVLNDADAAEDVVQEAFLRVYGQIGSYRGDCRFFTWFYRIVIRCCLNRMRVPYWKREREFLSDVKGVGERSSPEAETEARITVAKLLEGISPSLRAALLMREVEGMEYAEIAEALEIPVGTVRSRLNAARGQFREMWNQISEEANHV